MRLTKWGFSHLRWKCYFCKAPPGELCNAAYAYSASRPPHQTTAYWEHGVHYGRKPLTTQNMHYNKYSPPISEDKLPALLVWAKLKWGGDEG